ncbi:DUF488 family protein [Euzebya sp.]|uniref:DUF488 domain-containing protein n=1 Tax=Euzebya sp. TaxID=1971409 RepID=UPI00351104C1
MRLLTDADVEAVVDVRRFPGSRRHPHAARDAMARWLPEAGVGYRWDERLGGRRRPAEGSPHTGLRHPSFRAYADHMDTAEFATAVGELLEQLTEQRSVILCSESLWWRCHRRLIADHVTAVHGVDVRHLFHDGRLAHHRMTDVTRVEGDALVYDGGEPTLDLGDA